MSTDLLGRMTVLCVDDEELQLKVRQMLFEEEGFNVETAKDGIQALEIFRTKKIDAVVLDYGMSGMNGMAIAEEMKRCTPNIPIVILSGTAAFSGQSIGCVDAWLQKASSNPSELVDVVRKLATDKHRSERPLS